MMVVAVPVLLTGILLFVISLPLIKRKVPMNDFYGIRIPAAFESEQKWYEINEYGGLRLAAWSWLIVAAGAAGFFVPPQQRDNYVLASLIALSVALFIPIIQ